MPWAMARKCHITDLDRSTANNTELRWLTTWRFCSLQIRCLHEAVHQYQCSTGICGSLLLDVIRSPSCPRRCDYAPHSDRHPYTPPFRRMHRSCHFQMCTLPKAKLFAGHPTHVHAYSLTLHTCALRQIQRCWAVTTQSLHIRVPTTHTTYHRHITLHQYPYPTNSVSCLPNSA